MKNKLSMTIGISAYNEEANIGCLLEDLLKQKSGSFTVEKIIVVSDCSTDKTENIARSFKNSKIKLLINKKRLGIGPVQNIIIKNSDSDILIILNADTRVFSDRFLEKIANEMKTKEVDLLSPLLREIKPGKFFEKVLLTSMNFKAFLFEHFNGGNNVYTCYGRARAFSKKLYKRLNFPLSIGEDAYSFFYCVKNGFKYVYAKDIIAYYKLPDSYKDHKKQSIRFFQSKKAIAKIFGSDYVNIHYSFPALLIVKAFFIYLLKDPINMVMYAFVIAYLKLKSLFSKKIKETWDISESSKKIMLSK